MLHSTGRVFAVGEKERNWVHITSEAVAVVTLFPLWLPHSPLLPITSLLQLWMTTVGEAPALDVSSKSEVRFVP